MGKTPLNRKFSKKSFGEKININFRSTQLIDCPIGFEYCSTEMLVDWYSRGEQVVTIRRGCLEVPHADRDCEYGQSDRIRVSFTTFLRLFYEIFVVQRLFRRLCRTWL